jgi:signal transduction histidine kinase
MLVFRSPRKFVFLAIYGLIALCALVIVVALRMPPSGLTFTDGTAMIVAKSSDGKLIARLKPTEAVRFESGAGALTIAARELVADYEPNGTAKEISGYFARQNQLTTIIRHAPSTAHFLSESGQKAYALQPRARDIWQLPSDMWLLLLQSLLIGLLGVWLLALRPREWGARMFMISCLGNLIAGQSGAVYDARELTADGTLLHVMQALNFIGMSVSSMGLFALYLCQPKPLVKPKVAIALLCIAAILGLALGFGLLPLSFFYLSISAELIGFFVVIGLQWMATRGDPVSRSALKWVGTVSVICLADLTFAMAGPQIFDMPFVASDGMSIIPSFLLYGSIAFGIGHNRLISLDRWSYRVMLGALSVVALLILDGVFVYELHFEGRFAFAIALMAIGYLYLPLRNRLWQWVSGKPKLSESELFESGVQVAFAPTLLERRNAWRSLLTDLFDPLEMIDLQPEAARALREPQLANEGLEMVIPAVADEGALLLRHRDGGRRLFDTSQIALIRELVTFVQHAEVSRDAYARGVEEERQRIARDLHDDVSARLLTSLHRNDVTQVRSDVRKAMADIRSIINSLTGQKIALEQVIAELRHDTAERLEVAKIALVWPLKDDCSASHLLDYAIYKNLSSTHREIITNVIRHSGAKSVLVDVETYSGALHIAVEDNGLGLSGNSETLSTGNGMINMRSRIEKLKGRFSIAPSLNGTRVEVTIPLA